MAPPRRRTQPQLTESWASMDGNASPEPASSEDAARPPPMKLSASRTAHLRGAIGGPEAVSSDDARASKSSLRNSIHKSAISESTNQSPRERAPRAGNSTSQGPEFIMPSMSASHTPATSSSRAPWHVSERSAPKPEYYQEAHSPRQKHGVGSGADDSAKPNNFLPMLWSQIVSPFLKYALSIVQLAFVFAKPIISYALAIWLLVGGLIFARNFLTSSVTTALTPLCRIPGAAYLELPFCGPSNYTSETGPVEFDQLVIAQSAFEDVLTTSAGGASLPLDMKRSESSIRDLKHVVQYSTLPSRNELVFEFTGFIETARQASGDLAKYNSRIGRAVDRILSTNRWTLQVLDGVAETEASRGSVTRFLSDHMNIFAPFQTAPTLTQDILFEQYLRHTSAIEEQIQSLILEATALLTILQNLDDRLDVIASISTRDGIKAQDNRDEHFATLWTKLGGNRSSLAKLNAQLAVLRDVSAYRRLAWAHVSGTILKLQAIAANLEDLRERVARPEVLGAGRDQMPLEMHVREIVMGVERLEAVREEGRRVEGQRLRGILDKDQTRSIEGV